MGKIEYVPPPNVAMEFVSAMAAGDDAALGRLLIQVMDNIVPELPTATVAKLRDLCTATIEDRGETDERLST